MIFSNINHMFFLWMFAIHEVKKVKLNGSILTIKRNLEFLGSHTSKASDLEEPPSNLGIGDTWQIKVCSLGVTPFPNLPAWCHFDDSLISGPLFDVSLVLFNPLLVDVSDDLPLRGVMKLVCKACL